MVFWERIICEKPEKAEKYYHTLISKKAILSQEIIFISKLPPKKTKQKN